MKNDQQEQQNPEEENPVVDGSDNSEIRATGDDNGEGGGNVGNDDDYDDHDYHDDENDHGGHFHDHDKPNNDTTAGDDVNVERLPQQQQPIHTSLNDEDKNNQSSLNLNSATKSTTDDKHDDDMQHDNNAHDDDDDDDRHQKEEGEDTKQHDDDKNNDDGDQHEQHGDDENKKVQRQDYEQDDGNDDGGGGNHDPDIDQETALSTGGESLNSLAKDLLIEAEYLDDVDDVPCTSPGGDDNDKNTNESAAAFVVEDATPIIGSSSLHDDDDEMMMMMIESQLQKYVEAIDADENTVDDGMLDPHDISVEHASKNLDVSEERKQQPDDDASNADDTTSASENKKIRSNSDNIGESTTTHSAAAAAAATDNENDIDDGDEMSSISSRSVVALRRRKQHQHQQPKQFSSTTFGKPNNDSELDRNLGLDDGGDDDDDINCGDDDDDEEEEDDDIDDESDEYGNENGYDGYDYDDEDLDFDDDDLLRMRRRRRLRRIGTSGRNVFNVTGDSADDDFNTSSTLEGMILSIPVVVSAGYSPVHGDHKASNLFLNDQRSATDILPSFAVEEGELELVPTFEDFTSGEMAWEEAWREAEKMKETLCQTVGDAHSLHQEPGPLAVAYIDASHRHLSDQNSENSKVDSELSPIFFSPENGAKTFLPVPFQTDFMRGVQAPFLNDNDTDTSYSFTGEQSLTVTSEDHRAGTEVYEIGRIFDPSPLFVTNIEQIAPLIDRSDLGRKRSKKTKRKKGLNSDFNNLSATNIGMHAQSFDVPLPEDAHNMSQLSVGSNSDSSDPTKRIPSNNGIQTGGTNRSLIDGSGATPSSDDDCSVFSEDSRDSIADLVVKRSMRKKKKKGNTKKQRKKMRPKKRGKKADFQSLGAADDRNAETNPSLLIDDRIKLIFDNREMLYAEIDRRQAVWNAILKLNEDPQLEKKKSTFVRSKASTTTRQSRTKSRSPSRTGRSTRSLSQSRQEISSTPPRRSRSKSCDRSRSRSKSNDSHGPSKGASGLSIKRGKKQVLISTVADTRSKGKDVNENSPKHLSKSSKSTSSSSNFPGNSNVGPNTETITQEVTNLTLHPKPLKKNKGIRRKESISESEHSSSMEGKSASVNDLNESKISLATSTNGKEQSKKGESTQSPRSTGKTKTHELRRQALREKLDASSPSGKVDGVKNRKIKSLTSSPESSKGKSGRFEAAGLKKSATNLSNNLVDCLPAKKPKQVFQKEKKVSVAVADSENAKLRSVEKKVLAALTDKAQAKLPSEEKKVSAGADNKKTKLSSPVTRATKSSRTGNEKKKQRVLPSPTTMSDVVPGTQTGSCAVLHSQIQETSERLEDMESNTQLDILTMKRDVERRRSTLIGQIEEMKSKPLEATKLLNSSRVASLHSEGRELRRDIRRIERGMSQTASETQRLSLESQSINEQLQAVLADIARMERENARHVTELEKLRAEHDKVLSSSSFHNTSGVDVPDNNSSSSGSDDRNHEDHNTFLANVVPSLQDKSHDVELDEQQRPAQMNKHEKKKI